MIYKARISCIIFMRVYIYIYKSVIGKGWIKKNHHQYILMNCRFFYDSHKKYRATLYLYIGKEENAS